MQEFIKGLPDFERDICQTMFFVLLNQRISAPLDANYASTRARQLLSDESHRSLLEIYTRVMKQVVENSAAHRSDAKEYERLGYAGAVGIGRILFKKDSILSCGTFMDRLVELRNDRRVRDLADRVRQIDHMLRNGARGTAIAEMNAEAINVEKALYDGFRNPGIGRGIKIADIDVRDLLRKPSSAIDIFRAHAIQTSPRVGLITEILSL